ncbi:hypothetical protein [Psychroflexus tropicus]|uniref:hypothetical protein n=1 Tax=Psychroflexus tropicus TaxID=197345 RepID=UPI00036C27DD|nr:hypothetical protein [Psychroflexus tropicus]
MPANKKYLIKSGWAKASKVIDAILGSFVASMALKGFIVYLKRTEKKRKEKPKFIELKPLLLRWTYGMLAFILLMMVLGLSFGVVVPSLVVIISLYGTLIVLLIRALVLFIKRKLFSKKVVI